MAVDLVTAPEVELDLTEAYAWHERQRPGLGEGLLGRIDACIQAICRNPEMYAFVHKNYRRALVRKFPYAVFYEHVDGIVTVYCVLHTSRDPEKWRKRLP